MRDDNTHKSQWCGSCKEEQKWDTLRYCHNCQKDVWYNPDNLEIGNNSKNTDYFYYQKIRNNMFPYNKCVITNNITKEAK